MGSFFGDTGAGVDGLNRRATVGPVVVPVEGTVVVRPAEGLDASPVVLDAVDEGDIGVLGAPVVGWPPSVETVVVVGSATAVVPVAGGAVTVGSAAAIVSVAGGDVTVGSATAAVAEVGLVTVVAGSEDATVVVAPGSVVAQAGLARRQGVPSVTASGTSLRADRTGRDEWRRARPEALFDIFWTSSP